MLRMFGRRLAALVLLWCCLAPSSSPAAETCGTIRTSYNPTAALRSDAFTLRPDDPRWSAFLVWAKAKKLYTFQIVGLSQKKGEPPGILFRWATDTVWQKDVVLPFGQALGHMIAERRWRDTDFPEFFASRGGVFGVDLAERLSAMDARTLGPWQDFFHSVTAPKSPARPRLKARLLSLASDGRSASIAFGQDRIALYLADRLRSDLALFLTDCAVAGFFEEYDTSKGASPPFPALKGSRHDGFTEPQSRAPSPPSVHAERSVSEVEARAAPTLRLRSATLRVNGTPPAPRWTVPVNVSSNQKEISDTLTLRGKAIYVSQCSGCHGEAGDGQGMLTQSWLPRPRNFVRGSFRYRSTPSGSPPTDADLFRTVSKGLAGSGMPAFEAILSEPERRDVVAYIKQFSSRFASGSEPSPTSVSAPPQVTQQRIARGASLYVDSGCPSCHGAEGRGDGRSGQDLKTSEGDPIIPRDLTHKWSFRGGHTPGDIYRRIANGMDGSSMAAYEEVLEPNDLWDLVFYVLSLSPEQRPHAGPGAEHKQ